MGDEDIFDRQPLSARWIVEGGGKVLEVQEAISVRIEKHSTGSSGRRMTRVVPDMRKRKIIVDDPDEQDRILKKLRLPPRQ
jgi:DNA-directed RNA polymerase subunit E'/Rpb7